MILVHNLLAMNANRQLGIINKARNEAMYRLGSGYRINKAADDASGLSISEKMRAQIRGLNRGADNVRDGISLCQIADGALNETHATLQRMRELAVQAANDTNTDDDREAIQYEMDALVEEVDRIAVDTEFNAGIYPLLEMKTTYAMPAYLSIGTITVSNTTSGVVKWDNKEYQPGEEFTASCLYYNESADANILFPNKFPLYQYIQGESYNGGTTILGKTNSNQTAFKDGILAVAASYGGYSIASWGFDKDGNLYVNTTRSSDNKIYLGRDTTGRFALYRNKYQLNKNEKVIEVVPSFWIQAGANSQQGLQIKFVDATADGLGIQNADVTTNENAAKFLSVVDSAIEKVSEYRSQFGTYQNRLEYAYENDTNSSENLQAAESKIRDADMAETMVEYSKNDILIQAGQAMLAQANRLQEGVVRLLE